MTRVFSATATSKGLTVRAYTGDRCVMLAFDLDDKLVDLLAGFAIRRKSSSDTGGTFLRNRLNFEGAYTDKKLSPDGKFFSSDDAPYQKFWWIDFPPDEQAGSLRYEVIVKRFVSADSTTLRDDQRVEIMVDAGPFKEGNIEVGFTRGYLSSQAYADRFHNSPYQPKRNGGWEFDTGPFKEEWEWLGAHARQAIVAFLNDVYQDKTCTLDACIYDLNEPDIIRALEMLASEGRLRLLSDNDPKQHGDATAAGEAYASILAGAPPKSTSGFVRGRFGRFQHNKIFIKRVGGEARRVLTGSTNYSITGLYVNANHVVVIDEPEVAAKYGEAFDAALACDLKRPGFIDKEIAQKEYSFSGADLPPMRVSFAPHNAPADGNDPVFSLSNLLESINRAQQSVIFAVMDLEGKGTVIDALKKIHVDGKVFSYGISDSQVGDPEDPTWQSTTVFTPSQPGELVYSKANPEHFPQPFATELEVHGAASHVVHHKFVVVDFNGPKPVVFFGSSNLSDGGEKANGDNLLTVYDPAIATAFAIEGIRLVDHYAFAEALKKREDAGKAESPLSLKPDSAKWYVPFYENGNIRKAERLLFAHGSRPVDRK